MTTIKSLDDFEFLPDSTTDYRVNCPCMYKKQCLYFFSVAIDLIHFKLADKEEMHAILDVCKFRPDWIKGNRVTCL